MYACLRAKDRAQITSLLNRSKAEVVADIYEQTATKFGEIDCMGYCNFHSRPAMSWRGGNGFTRLTVSFQTAG